MTHDDRPQTPATPLLKWPGGKRSLSKYILPLFPYRFKRYFEPFVGGGAVFFSLLPSRATLSDADPDLINCYRQVRDCPTKVIDRLSRLKNNEDDYYKIRASTPRTDAARAARLIYLTTLSFNGIYRLNTQGEFNVPYGYRTHFNVCNREKIMATSAALAGTTLKSCDFEKAISSAGPEDAVYLDPPYTVAHGNNGFLKYNAKIFSWSDQERLAKVAQRLAAKGCTVVVSNADHESIISLYKDFSMIRATRSSSISSKVESRDQITECIFYKGTARC